MKGRKPVKPGSEKMNIADVPPNNNGTLDRDIQEVIGKQLRAMYDDLVNQPVPDRFADLLQNLDKQDNKEKP
jgi:hypothetical protein